MLPVTFSSVLKMSGIASAASIRRYPGSGMPAATYSGAVLISDPPLGMPRVLKLRTIEAIANVMIWGADRSIP
jgi:hypothetical protein